MNPKVRNYLLLAMSAGHGTPVEGAVLAYVWTGEPVRERRLAEEPPRAILRRISGAAETQRVTEAPVMVTPRRRPAAAARPWL